MFINKTKDGLNNISGKNIAKLRTEMGISQRILAERMQLVGIDLVVYFFIGVYEEGRV